MICSKEKGRDCKVWISIVCALLFLSGCSASSFSHKKWIEGNAIHSEGMPKLTIKVDDTLKYKKSNAKINNSVGSDHVSKSTRVNTKVYIFESKDNKRLVTVRIETIHEPNWYMEELNFKGMEGVFETSRVKLNGTSFNTAIFAEKHNNTPLLIKLFTSTYGSDCRVNVYYVEQVDKKWLNAGTLSNEQTKTIREYSQRADASFKIMPLATTAKAAS